MAHVHDEEEQFYRDRCAAQWHQYFSHTLRTPHQYTQAIYGGLIRPPHANRPSNGQPAGPTSLNERHSRAQAWQDPPRDACPNVYRARWRLEWEETFAAWEATHASHGARKGTSSITHNAKTEDQVQELYGAKVGLVHLGILGTHLEVEERRRAVGTEVAYESQLASGLARASAILNAPRVREGLAEITIEGVVRSAPLHWRLRSKFGWSDSHKAVTLGPHGAVLTGGSDDPSDGLFPMGSIRMNEILSWLPPILVSSAALHTGLQQIDILTCFGTPDAVITLVYNHGTLVDTPDPSADPAIETKANRLRRARAVAEAASGSGPATTIKVDWFATATAVVDSGVLGKGVSIVGRCRRTRWVVGKGHVTEQLSLPACDAITGPTSAAVGPAEEQLMYRQAVGSFSNPNGSVNVGVLQWLRERCATIAGRTGRKVGTGRLLELYNGCGNHTVAIARLFESVVAVEMDPSLTAAAAINCELNKVTNVVQITQSCEAFATQLACSASEKSENTENNTAVPTKSSQEQQRVFEVALVDPPRTGMSTEAMAVIVEAEDILFLSCNQDRLAESLVTLDKTHSIVTLAYMDHFPYSLQSECGVHLQRRAHGK